MRQRYWRRGGVLAALLGALGALPAEARRFPLAWHDASVCDTGSTVFPRIALGDLDRDGIVDLVRSEPARIAWCRGLGDAEFGPPQTVAIFNGGAPADLQLVDLDRDADLDVLIAASEEDVTQVAHWFANDGQGGFGPARPTFALALADPGVRQVEAVDLDRDADADLVVRVNGSIAFGYNGGAGTFASPALLVAPHDIEHFALGDLDRDGLPDLALSYGALVGWARNAAGAFDVAGVIGAEGSWVHRVAVADVDRDGAPDLQLARESEAGHAAFQLHPGLGGGAFGPVRDLLPGGLPGGSGRLLSGVDLDLDARPDLACQRRFGEAVLPCWLQNLAQAPGDYAHAGPWRVGPFAGPPSSWGDPLSQQAADLDRDGDPDLLMSAEQHAPRRSRNDSFFGRSALRARPQPFAAAPRAREVRHVASGDLLAAGHDQAVYAIADGLATDVVLTGRRGGAPDVPLHDDATPALEPDAPLRLAVARLDADAHPDLLVLDGTRRRVVWRRNPGQAADVTPWEERPIALDEGRTRWFDTGDIDGDGRLDVVAGRAGHTTQWWRQPADGTAPWSTHLLVADPGLAGPLALADFNLDGKLDLLSAGSDGVYWARALLAGGSWQFHLADPTATSVTAVRTADMDRDGDPDALLVADADRALGARLRLLLNPRDHGAWPAREFELGTLVATDLAVRDVDRDGDPDVVVAAGADGVRWFENDGAAHFSRHEGSPDGDAATLALADLDGDGDSDALLASSGAGGPALRAHGFDWGQVSVRGVDPVAGAVRFGDEFALLGFDVAHLGRPASDGPARLDRLFVRLLDAQGAALDTAQARALVQDARLVRDDGDGVPSAQDVPLGDVGAPLLVDGLWSLALGGFDSALRQVEPDDHARFFLLARVPLRTSGGTLVARFDPADPAARHDVELRPAFLPIQPLANRAEAALQAAPVLVVGSLVFGNGFE